MIDPTVRSAKFASQVSNWNKVDALYGGTETMRRAGAAYCPRNTKESETDWLNRLNRSTLYNAYRRTIQQAVARVFSEDITFEGYPGEITIFSADVDSQGSDLTQFAKSMFSDALNRGVSYVLVEFPKREVQPLTLADAIASNDRPYWVPIKATQVLAAHSTLIAGKDRLTHFRFCENVTNVSADGLTETTVEQVRAFNRLQTPEGSAVQFIVYRKVEGEWVVYDEGVLVGMTEIPAVPDYTNRIAFFLGEPPMLDLAETNIAHWQSTSEQRNILHVARVPFLHMAGFGGSVDPETGAKKEQEISIHSVAMGPDQSKVEWVETNGNALEAGREDLADLEAKMDALGISISAQRSGNTTATENSINAAEANSLLKDMALALGDCLEQALSFTAMYLGTETAENGKVVVSTKFAVDLKPDAKEAVNKEGQTNKEMNV
jgi:hypothetical protein